MTFPLWYSNCSHVLFSLSAGRCTAFWVHWSCLPLISMAKDAKCWSITNGSQSTWNTQGLRQMVPRLKQKCDWAEKVRNTWKLPNIFPCETQLFINIIGPTETSWFVFMATGFALVSFPLMIMITFPLSVRWQPWTEQFCVTNTDLLP